MRLKNQKLIHKGKVRDVYLLANGNLLIVTTDRVSAYDTVLPTEIPGRGIVLNQMSNFWMEKLQDIVPNHIVDARLGASHGSTAEEQDWLHSRCVEVKRLVPLRVEAIARGFISGSAWAQYQESGTVNGIQLPEGLQRSQRLPQPIYTPSTKDKHDENISYLETITRGLLTGGRAIKIRGLAMSLYEAGNNHAKSRGLICADTKFEFGFDPKYPDEIYLIDEALTPDSSRFWEASQYEVGTEPPSYDKQIIRNYLDSIGWDRVSPPPELPEAIVKQVEQRYWDALKRIAGKF